MKSIYKMKAEMNKYLQQCQTDFERGCCRALCIKEIRENAKEMELTSADINALNELGITI